MNRLFLAIFVLCGLLTGCGSEHRPADIFNYEQESAGIEDSQCMDCGWNVPRWVYTALTEPKVTHLNPLRYGNYYAIATASPSNIGSQCVNGKLGATKEEPKGFTVRERARNELIGASLRLADRAVSTHLAGIKATEVNVNLLLGAATTGLTGGPL